MLQHAQIGCLLGCLFGRVAFLARFVIRRAERRVFDRCMATWHLGENIPICYSIYVMSAAATKNSKKESAPSNKSTVVLLFTIAADTTWRMFVPVIGGTLVGIQLDHMFGVKPLLTAAGIFAGVGVAALLVRQQLKKGSGND